MTNWLLASSAAMLKRILSLRGRFQRKVLLVLVLVMVLLLLLLKSDGGGDGRHYPPELPGHKPAQRVQDSNDHNGELKKLQEELLQEDVRMNALENIGAGDEGRQRVWIKVNEAHLPGPQDNKMVDVEAFERPLAVTLDTTVMTREGRVFLKRLQAGSLSSPNDSGVTIMTVNFKVGPLFDLRFTLDGMGVTFIEHSFSPHCEILGTCSKLKVLTEENAMTLSEDTVSRFYKRYSEDEVFQRVDAFLCVYPAALCELFIPFNKSIIVVMESRYDIGRLEPHQWKTWNENLLSLTEHEQPHFVRATNAYESEYVRFFTNYAPHVTSPVCGYVQHSYSPSQPEFLLMPIRQAGFEEQFLKEFHDELRELDANVTMVPVLHRYPEQKPSDLVQHPALVLVPHQVSYLSLSEYYHLGIPMFVPAMELLARWHLRSNVVYDKMWNERRKWQKRYGLFKGLQPLPNANDESVSDAIGFWLMFSDYYYQPNFIYYMSVADLVRKLAAVNQGNWEDLRMKSQNMKTFSGQIQRKGIREWQNVVDDLMKLKTSRNV